MSDTIRSVDYYHVTVADKPGEGLGVLSKLKQEGVNLLSFLAFPAGRGKSQVDLIPEDVELFKKAAKRGGLKLSDRKRAFLVQGDDRPGSVAEVVAKLSAQKINLTAGQAVCAGSGRWGMLLWVRPEDFRKASKALGL